MNFRAHLLIAVLVLAGIEQTKASSFVITLDQEGNNVVATGSGTVDLNGLTEASGGAADISIDPSVDYLLLSGGSGTTTTQWWSGITSGPYNFGYGGETFPSTSSGGTFSLWSYTGAGPFYILLDPSYVSGAILSDSATWDNATLLSLGITPGTYTWSWDDGANTYTLYAGTAVPEPSYYGFLIALAVAVLVARRKLQTT